MRNSEWRIVWAPGGDSPRLLLDRGDTMQDELSRSVVQLTDTGKFDFATSGRPRGRGNRRRRLEFSRLAEFDSAIEAWQAMVAETRNDPWALKDFIGVSTGESGPALCRAALLSVSRQPTNEWWRPGFWTKYSFRVDGGLYPDGPAVTIIGGWYNPPVPGGGTGSGGITVVVPDDTTLQPGDTVDVHGVPGVPDGQYVVTGVTHGGGTGSGGGGGAGSGQATVDIKAPHDKDPIGDSQEFTMQSGLDSSPNFGTWHAVAFGAVEISASVAFQVLEYADGFPEGRWVSYAASPSAYTLATSESVTKYFTQPKSIRGEWSGLTSTSGDRQVTFTSAVSVLRWRLVGGQEQRVIVPLRARGKVSYQAGNGGIHSFTTAPLPLTIGPTGGTGGAGTIPGGGSLQKVK